MGTVVSIENMRQQQQQQQVNAAQIDAYNPTDCASSSDPMISD